MGLVAPQFVYSSQTGTEPMSPALAGRFFTTEPPGKAMISRFILYFYHYIKKQVLPWVILTHSIVYHPRV